VVLLVVLVVVLSCQPVVIHAVETVHDVEAVEIADVYHIPMETCLWDNYHQGHHCLSHTNPAALAVRSAPVDARLSCHHDGVEVVRHPVDRGSCVHHCSAVVGLGYGHGIDQDVDNPSLVADRMNRRSGLVVALL